MDEYELAGIETIARGIAIRDGMLLLCRAKGGSTAYLPGGHIEFGETGRAALEREIREELGVASRAGAFRGIVENSFLQHGKPHAEINLVYELTVELPSDTAAGKVAAQEDWIEFEWCPLSKLGEARLLPAAFQALAQDPAAFFEPC